MLRAGMRFCGSVRSRRRGLNSRGPVPLRGTYYRHRVVNPSAVGGAIAEAASARRDFGRHQHCNRSSGGHSTTVPISPSRRRSIGPSDSGRSMTCSDRTQSRTPAPVEKNPCCRDRERPSRMAGQPAAIGAESIGGVHTVPRYPTERSAVRPVNG
jgi:hypothetical protein